MVAETGTRLISEDELMSLGEDVWAEVVDGRIVLPQEGSMTPTGALHNIVAGNVFRILDQFGREHDLGVAFTDGLIYVLDETAEGIRTARVPDVSFVRRERLSADLDLRRPFPGAPDLAVEVISPGESAGDVLSKVRDYLSAGAAQVWVLYPDQRELHRHLRGSQSVDVFAGDQAVDVSDLLPGLSFPARDCFAIPEFD
jgi:Uma2 family endonuclease